MRSNSTGNDTLIGENTTDTITGGSGNDTVELKGAGTINAGAGNDLGIYTLSDHDFINCNGQLQSLSGDVDYDYRQAGIIPSILSLPGRAEPSCCSS